MSAYLNSVFVFYKRW